MRDARVVPVRTLSLLFITALLSACSGGGGGGGSSGVFIPPPLPTINTISPAFGAPAGTNSVTISGTNFDTGNTVVRFDTRLATNVQVTGTTSLTCTVPSEAQTSVRTVDVSITTPIGTVARANGYDYTNVSITQISPNFGDPAGNAAVRITGTGFQASSTVSLGGNPATVQAITGTTIIDILTPVATSPGFADVTVVTPSNGSATLQKGYSYTAAVVAPTLAGNQGGVTVVLTGNFGAGASIGNTRVEFGVSGKQLILGTVNANRIEGTTPTNVPLGSVDVILTIASLNGGLAQVIPNGFTFEAPATVSGITPNSGSINGNETITIAGTNFKNVSSVALGAFPAQIINVTPTQITATTGVATQAGSVNVSVVTSNHGTATLNAGFQYNGSAGGQPPSGNIKITNVTPSAGPNTGLIAAAQQTITVDGSGFTGTVGVTVSDPATSPAFAPVTPTNIVPNGAGTKVTFDMPNVAATAGAAFSGRVAITVVSSTNGGASLEAFTYFSPGGGPVITDFSPKSGPESGDTVVTITGGNFVVNGRPNLRGITFGAFTGLSVIVDSPSQIRVTTPVAAESKVPVSIINLQGNPVPLNTVTFDFTKAIVIDSIDRNQGPVAGGTPVTVTGRNFLDANGNPILTAVNLGTLGSLGSLQVLSATKATGNVPPAQIGTLSDVVAVGSLPSSTLERAYTYGPLFGQPFIGSIAAGAGNIREIESGEIDGGGRGNDVVVLTNSRILPVFNGVAAAAITNGLNNPLDCELADLNNDGNLDLVVANEGTNQLLVYLFNGAAFASTPSTVALSGTGTPRSLAFGYFDDDGNVDVAVAKGGAAGANEIQILTGNGAGGFSSKGSLPLPSGAIPIEIRCADPTAAPLNSLPRQDRDFDSLKQPDLLDLNGDGQADLVVANQGSNNLSIFLGDKGLGVLFAEAAGSPFANGTGGAVTMMVDMALTDLDQDCSIDVITANNGAAEKNIRVFRGGGNGTVAEIGTHALPASGIRNITGIDIGDFNQDCRPDVIVTTFNKVNASVYLGRGTGDLASPINYVCVPPANFSDGDIADLRIVDRGFYAWDEANDRLNFVPQAFFLNVTGEPQAPGAPFPVGLGAEPQAVIYAQIDANCANDLVTTQRNPATFTITLNDGAGGVLPNQVFQTGAQPVGVAAGDVDNDGDNDIAIAAFGDNSVTLHRNLGGGIFGAGVNLPIGAGQGPLRLVIIDVNNDNAQDIVTINNFSNDVTILLNTPGNLGTYLPARFGGNQANPIAVFPTGNSPFEVVPFDINRDGKIDFVIPNSGDDDVTVMLNTTANTSMNITFTTNRFPLTGVSLPASTAPGVQAIVRTGVEPVDLVVGDINRDGVVDIITADKRAGTFTILHGDPTKAPGTAYFGVSTYRHNGNLQSIGAPPIILKAGVNPSAIALADVDIDGDLDIIVGNQTSSNIMVYIVTGSRIQDASDVLPGVDFNNGVTSSVAGANAPVGIGETAFENPNPSPLGPPDFESPLRFVSPPTTPGPKVIFTTAAGGNISDIAVKRLDLDCLPDTAATLIGTNQLTVLKGK